MAPRCTIQRDNGWVRGVAYAPRSHSSQTSGAGWHLALPPQLSTCSADPRRALYGVCLGGAFHPKGGSFANPRFTCPVWTAILITGGDGVLGYAFVPMPSKTGDGKLAWLRGTTTSYWIDSGIKVGRHPRFINRRYRACHVHATASLLERLPANAD
jgi:hypothetical protein